MTSKYSVATLIAAVIALASGLSAQSPPAGETFSMALTGNALMTRPLSLYKEPPFLQMIELIRGADVAMTAVETGFNDYESYPMTEVGTYMRGAPALAK